MANVMAGSLGGRFYISDNNAPGIVSFLINYNCNLSCKHCYLQNAEGSALPKDEWRKIWVSLFRDLRPKAVSFAGKEVFANRKSAETFFEALDIRDKYDAPTEIHIITNGTLTHLFKDELQARAHQIAGFDISIEGPRHIHDFIRGQGAFEKVERNLPWLAKTFKNKLWITPTLYDGNVTQIPSMIRHLHKFDIKNFSLGIYKPRFGSEQRVKIHNEAMEKLPEAIRQIADLPVTIVVGVDTSTQEYLIPFSSYGELPKENFARKEISLGNATLILKQTRIPTGLWNAIRVDPKGNWAAVEDLMELPFQEKLAVANLKDLNFDTVQAYAQGLESKKDEEIQKIASFQ